MESHRDRAAAPESGAARTRVAAVLRRLRDHTLTISLVLAWPLVGLFESWRGGASYGLLMFQTGDWASRMLILSLAITPLGLVFARFRWWRWVRRRRRHVGLAAFAYTALHAVVYLREIGAISRVVAELAMASLWTGWLALALMVPLAVTSTDGAVRRMGRRWLTLHRLAYPIVVLAALHWYLVEGHLRPVALYFGPLAALEAIRVAWRLARRPRAAR